MTSALVHAQDFTQKMGLPAINVLMTGTDKSTLQYRAIFQEVIRELGQYRWPTQRLTRTWSALAASDQGTLTSSALFGAGYDGLVKDSMWNLTKKMQIFGPVSEQEWQALQNIGNAGPLYQYWISNNHLYLSPAPKLADSLSVVYITKYNVLAVDGVTTKERLTADDDTILFPDICVFKLFEAKWKKQKGEPGWEDDWNEAMGFVMKNIVKDTATSLSMATPNRNAQRPGIIVPPGSWGV